MEILFMLIVAIPKSASTSLMETIGRLHNIAAKQTFFKDYSAPTALKVLHRYHSDIREIAVGQVKPFQSAENIFKQHIPPTETNLELLCNVKKVILLRAPIEIIGAYCRSEKKKLHPPRPEFKDCRTIEDWHRVANQNGLLKDIEWFYDEWIKEAKREPLMNLVINYSDLVHDSKTTINQIESFFGLKISENITLSKKRYSRHHPLYYSSQEIRKKVRRSLRNKRSANQTL